MAHKPPHLSYLVWFVALLTTFPSSAMASSPVPSPAGPVQAVPDVTFTLSTGIAEGRMVFLGVGGSIDKQADPTLRVEPGDVVQINLRNGEGAEHDIAIPEFHVVSNYVIGQNASTAVVFKADRPGVFSYFCTLPGHRQAGMEGQIVVGNVVQAAPSSGLDISRDPADLPPPIGDRPPERVKFNLEAIERKGLLAPGTTYDYWTFNGKVPGPFLRVRVGDTVEIHLKNDARDRMIHSIDLHCVMGPGGGSALMQVPPGQEQVFTWKALYPGLFVYHCATPMVAEHISNGMYGMVLVEPPGGLPKVDREFYVMQGELYTNLPFGQHGLAEFDEQRMLDERPTEFVFNGAVGALTDAHPMRAKVGESVRIFFGVGGPNYSSSLHVIGSLFDKAYLFGSLTTQPLRDIQTISVPPGGSTIVELRPMEPGRYVVVDHALARMEQGLVGFLNVTGKADPSIDAAGPARVAPPAP
ncbi:MAG: nitrite reductase, copper-containing [Cyanobacteria bacterium REEB65]|nr:nitrite reductase, copper-containing [Cyanobacteria bacterium REEB65]